MKLLSFHLLLLFPSPTVIGGGSFILESNLILTGRNHACVNETISFYCAGGPGIQIVWNINDTELPFFDNTAKLPDAKFANGVTAFVVVRKPVFIENDTQYEYISYALLRVSPQTQVVNVTCSDGFTVADNSSVRVSDMPDPLTVCQPNCTEIGESSAQVYVEWFAPNNRNNFDLRYYEIIITTNSMSIQRYLSLKTSLAFSVDANLVHNADSAITVTAVSKCGDSSDMSAFQPLKCDGKNSSPKLKSLSLWLMFYVHPLLFTYFGFV